MPRCTAATATAATVEFADAFARYKLQRTQHKVCTISIGNKQSITLRQRQTYNISSTSTDIRQARCQTPVCWQHARINFWAELQNSPRHP